MEACKYVFLKKLMLHVNFYITRPFPIANRSFDAIIETRQTPAKSGYESFSQVNFPISNSRDIVSVQSYEAAPKRHKIVSQSEPDSLDQWQKSGRSYAELDSHEVDTGPGQEANELATDDDCQDTEPQRENGHYSKYEGLIPPIVAGCFHFKVPVGREGFSDTQHYETYDPGDVMVDDESEDPVVEEYQYLGDTVTDSDQGDDWTEDEKL